MNVKNTITVTSKGQTTIPAAIRKKLGVSKHGGVLQITFNEERGELIISKPLTIEDLSNKLSTYIKPHTPPLMDVDTYYQANR